MKKIFLTTLVVLVATLFSCTEQKDNAMEKDNLIKKEAFEPQNMDSTVDLSDDFFRYVNGTWMKNHPIPEDKTMYGAFNELADENEIQIRDIIAEVSADTAAPQGSIAQKIRDLYNTGMDTVAIEERGTSELIPYFERIDGINNLDDLAQVLALNHTEGFGGFFAFGGEADPKNAEMVVASITQRGISLPDRDDFLRKDKAEQQEQYRRHVARMFGLVGFDNNDDRAQRIYNLEYALAEKMMSRKDRRDPVKTYNPMTREEFFACTPNFNWNTYFNTLGAPQFDTIIVNTPDYIKALNDIFSTTDIETMKDYLKWFVINASANALNKELDEADFDFYAKYLYGQEQQEARWKRMVGSVNGMIGEAVGQIYVKKYFPAEAKQRMINLINGLKNALATRIYYLDWMSDDTKEAAIKKLNSMRVKVGYPDKWKDYSDLNITNESFFKNVRQFAIFSTKDELSRIGKPVDKEEWPFYPQLINACYMPNNNEIIFPAGILQPPFFNMNADDAINYGGIGVVIGHEMTHGFDNHGCLYDEKGNLNNWWKDVDFKNFDEKTKILEQRFNEFQLNGINIKGDLTLGENIADLGGLNIALDAFLMTEQAHGNEPIDGFTPVQRFFISYATIWRMNIRDKALERRITDDEHSPAEARVNRTLFVMPRFYDTFKINPEGKLYVAPNDRVSIW